MQVSTRPRVERPIRICFLVRQLNTGGAQRQLVELVRSLDKRRFSPVIMSLYPGGEFSAEASRVPEARYVCIGKCGRWDVSRFLWRLAREMGRVRPDIVQGYIGICNILALSMKTFLPRTRVIWSIRCSEPDFGTSSWLPRLAFRAERMLSKLPDAIIANSNAGKEFHVTQGFPAAKITVVHNGIDTRRFQPDCAGRARMRREWQIAPAEVLVGVAGRIHPQKDHPVFLRAAAQVAGRRPDVRFVIVGDGAPEYVDTLKRLALELGLERCLVWAGAVTDMTAAYNALDVFTSCSYSEGFSNVLCEAMSCGLPPVATAVGDSAFIVGDAGILVPRGDPDSLGGAWMTMLSLTHADRTALGCRARVHIQQECAQELLARKTSAVFEAVL